MHRLHDTMTAMEAMQRLRVDQSGLQMLVAKGILQSGPLGGDLEAAPVMSLEHLSAQRIPSPEEVETRLLLCPLDPSGRAPRSVTLDPATPEDAEMLGRITAYLAEIGWTHIGPSNPRPVPPYRYRGSGPWMIRDEDVDELAQGGLILGVVSGIVVEGVRVVQSAGQTADQQCVLYVVRPWERSDRRAFYGRRADPEPQEPVYLGLGW